MSKPCRKCGGNNRNADGKCRPCKLIASNKWAAENPEKRKASVDKWRHKNPEKVKANRIRYHLINPKYMTHYSRKRYNTDVSYRLVCVLRSRLRAAIRNNVKTGSAVRDLGCSIDALKLHIEKQFQSGMSWDNWGKWQIDHIVPLSKFDLTNKEQIEKACHFSNLQPLWSKDNQSKGAKITAPSLSTPP